MTWWNGFKKRWNDMSFMVKVGVVTVMIVYGTIFIVGVSIAILMIFGFVYGFFTGDTNVGGSDCVSFDMRGCID